MKTVQVTYHHTEHGYHAEYHDDEGNWLGHTDPVQFLAPLQDLVNKQLAVWLI